MLKIQANFRFNRIQSGGLALATASRPIPGAIPLERQLVLPPYCWHLDDFQSTAQKMNHFEAWMSALEATDETETQLKISALMENAIRKALLPTYQTKIIEYDDVSTIFDLFNNAE